MGQGRRTPASPEVEWRRVMRRAKCAVFPQPDLTYITGERTKQARDRTCAPACAAVCAFHWSPNSLNDYEAYIMLCINKPASHARLCPHVPCGLAFAPPACLRAFETIKK